MGYDIGRKQGVRTGENLFGVNKSDQPRRFWVRHSRKSPEAR